MQQLKLQCVALEKMDRHTSAKGLKSVAEALETMCKEAETLSRSKNDDIIKAMNDLKTDMPAVLSARMERLGKKISEWKHMSQDLKPLPKCEICKSQCVAGGWMKLSCGHSLDSHCLTEYESQHNPR